MSRSNTQQLIAPPDPAYNYQSTPFGIFVRDIVRSRSTGPQPGELAPDFELTATSGETIRLSDQAGQPVILIFGSATCPMTRGSLAGLKALHQENKDDDENGTRWLFVYAREAHPGEEFPAPISWDEKRANAAAFVQQEKIPWTVLVDDIDGSVHRAYGMLPNSAWLIDASGRIVFRDDWASAPTLARAQEALAEHSDAGVPIAGGRESMVHLAPALAYGWPAVSRGGGHAVKDMALKAPLAAGALWLGQYAQPVLGRIAGRGEPLPTPLKAVASLAVLGAIVAFLLPRINAHGEAKEGKRFQKVAEGKAEGA